MAMGASDMYRISVHNVYACVNNRAARALHLVTKTTLEWVNFSGSRPSNTDPRTRGQAMRLRTPALAASALMTLVTAPGLAQAAGYHHGGPRVSIGVGIGVGGFFDPYPYDPFYYPPYGVYGYVPHGPVPVPVPCTQAEIDKVPTNKIDDPSYAYDRIDAARCAAQAAATAQAAAQPQAPAVPVQAYYFCRSANAYYPNVKDCAEGWQQVAPRPPGT